MQKIALCSKTNCFQNLSVSDKMFPYFAKKLHFVAISKTAIWAFIFWLRYHLTPILVIAAKQYWFQFEAYEYIFHLSIIFFAPYISWLAINNIERSLTYGVTCMSLFLFYHFEVFSLCKMMKVCLILTVPTDYVAVPLPSWLRLNVRLGHDFQKVNFWIFQLQKYGNHHSKFHKNMTFSHFA